MGTVCSWSSGELWASFCCFKIMIVYPFDALTIILCAYFSIWIDSVVQNLFQRREHASSPDFHGEISCRDGKPCTPEGTEQGEMQSLSSYSSVLFLFFWILWPSPPPFFFSCGGGGELDGCKVGWQECMMCSELLVCSQQREFVARWHWCDKQLFLNM